MKKTIFVFSALIVALLILFQLGKYSFIRGNMAVELIIAIIAIVFLFLGFYLNRKTAAPKEMAPQQIDTKKIKELGISQREYQVLIEISHGLSNKEIGKKLFISESTIKTHVSNLFVKLNAKRRTQAIQRAKELHIITP
ncbi:response regulator transcription factor [Allomuricauda sp. SCSIO 65647]|uniref:response regulator transcription factor n=1 Tax=Allomuricauda sp. SCSIO 65647 TaxID=2908843 RepID=UPI0028BF532D|nr:response regulator transcription factor [Muricauda sp. SCSIO 65647]